VSRDESGTGSTVQHLPASTPRWVIVPLIASLLMLAPFTVDAYLPSFPDIARNLHVPESDMQHTLSIYLWFFAGMMLVYGPASDAWGRKRMVSIALLVYFAASVGAALAVSLDQLIWARIGQGMAAGAGVVIGRALVRDLFHGAQAQRVMANIMLVFAAAPAVAPILGGWLHHLFGWRSVFWFLAIAGLALLLAVRRFMPETVGAHNRQSIHPAFVARSYLLAMLNAPFVLLVLIFAFMFAGMFLYIAAAPNILIIHLGQSSTDFWKFFVPLVTGLILGSRLSSFFAHRLQPVQTVSIGLGLGGFAVVYNLVQVHLAVQHDVWLTVTPITFYAMGLATAMPGVNLMGLDYIPAQRGLASALQGFTQMTLAGLVSALLVTPLSVHLAGLAWGMAGLFATAVVLWIVWLRTAPRIGFAAGHPAPAR